MEPFNLKFMDGVSAASELEKKSTLANRHILDNFIQFSDVIHERYKLVNGVDFCDDDWASVRYNVKYCLDNDGFDNPPTTLENMLDVILMLNFYQRASEKYINVQFDEHHTLCIQSNDMMGVDDVYRISFLNDFNYSEEEIDWVLKKIYLKVEDVKNNRNHYQT